MNRVAAAPLSFVRALRPQRVAPLGLLVGGTLAAATVGAIAVLAAAGMRVEASGFARFALLAAAMLALSVWCARRYPDPRLAHAAAIVGVGTLSLMLCGVVSNAGLRLGLPLVDPALAGIDAAFGLDVEAAVRALAAFPRAIDLLATIYNASGAAVVVLIALALAAGRFARAWELAATAVFSMQVVAAVSILLPASGAMAYLGMIDLQGAGLPAGAGVYHLAAFEHFRAGSGGVLRLTDLTGLVTFPSFHTVLALLTTQALWDTRLRWLAVGWAGSVIVSTIPIGGHYVVDLAAGFLVWMIGATLARRAAVSNPSA